MRFLKIRWVHNHPDEPSVIYQEVGEDSWETRKVELLKGGGVLGYASEAEEVGNSILSNQPIPSIEKINASSEFNAEIITKDEFENIWAWASSQHPSR